MKSHLLWLTISISLYLAGTLVRNPSPPAAGTTENKAGQSTAASPALPSNSSKSERLSGTTDQAGSGFAVEHSGVASNGVPSIAPSLSKQESGSATSNSPSNTRANKRAGISTSTEGSSTPATRPNLTPEQIDTLVAEAVKASDPISRRLAFDELLKSIDDSTAIPIRTALAKNKATGEHWRLFDYAWSSGNPEVVKTYLPNTADQHKMGFISNSLPGWAFSDPVGAAEYVNNYEPGPTQDLFRNRLIEGLADNDIDMATEFVLEIANDNHPQTPQYIQTVAKEVLETKGPTGFKDWANTLPNGLVRESAMSSLPQADAKD